MSDHLISAGCPSSHHVVICFPRSGRVTVTQFYMNTSDPQELYGILRQLVDQLASRPDLLAVAAGLHENVDFLPETP